MSDDERSRFIAEDVDTTITPADKSLSHIALKFAYVSLSLKENVQITRMINQLKRYLPKDAVDFTLPDDYHLTLVHMPEMERGEVLDGIAETIIPRPLELEIEDLEIMGDDNALVAKVKLTGQLKTAQYDVFSQVAVKDVTVSEFHQPDNFIPHITLGYYLGNPQDDLEKIEFNGGVIKAHDVLVSVKDGEDYKDVATVKMISPVKAIEEVKTWVRFRKKAMKSGNLKPFTFMKVRPSVAEMLSGGVLAGKSNGDLMADAIKMLSVKALETTKSNYLNAVRSMIQDGRTRKITEVKFRENYRNLQKNTIARVFTDGLEDAGVFEDQTPETKEAIRKLKLEPTPFVKDFAKKLFSKEGITDAEAFGKPELWFNGSISSAYNAGLIAGNENGMYEFGGKSGKKNPCDDCGRLIILPDRHRLKAWDRRGLNMAKGAFVGQKTFCGGWKCLHLQFRTTGRAQGKF